MSRLVDIDSLKGCAIIRPTSHESIEHIKQCGNDILNHNDIPTAYDADAVVAELEEEREYSYADFEEYVNEKSPCLDAEYDNYFYRGLERAIKLVKRGGVE